MWAYPTRRATASSVVRERVVRSLGFAPNPLAARFVDDAGVSDEQVGLLDADVLVAFYPDAASRTARKATPLFRALRPVAGGRYIGLAVGDPGIEMAWVMRRGASATSLPWAVRVLAEKVDTLDLG